MENGSGKPQWTRRDPRAHDPECRHSGEPYADETSTHVDLFCDCHTWKEPRILSNGTDIAWPAGWDEAQAREWRRDHGLEYPSQPGAGP